MLDIKTIESDLLRMKIEIDRVLDSMSDSALIQRNGSIKGRRFHVQNTLRQMQLRNQWKVSQ